MATGQSSTPSFFNFLKEGLLLPSHNRRLFAAVFTIIAVSTCLLLLGNDLAVQPLIDELDLDTKALNSTDPSTSSPEDILQLIQKTKDDIRALLLTSAALVVLSVIIGYSDQPSGSSSCLLPSRHTLVSCTPLARSLARSRRS